MPFDKDTIKGAPHFDAGARSSETDEQELYSYHGLGSQGTDVVDGDFTDRARARLDTTGTAGTDAEISPRATGSVDGEYQDPRPGCGHHCGVCVG